MITESMRIGLLRGIMNAEVHNFPKIKIGTDFFVPETIGSLISKLKLQAPS